MVTTRKVKNIVGLHEITVEERHWIILTNFNVLTPTE